MNIIDPRRVSMKSGLRDRNNVAHARHRRNGNHLVSMDSGLRDRNNLVLWVDEMCSAHAVSQ